MQDTKILQNHAEIITSNTLPPPRFGHTVNLVSKTTIVVFGGAISTPGNYTMTADLYLYSMPTNQWKKLETSSIGRTPHARAAHASATVRESQLLFYGGSIGNGQYAQDDLWFLDIKNNEDASWMQVPIEGATPGPRYGHSMVYILPVLVLFGGSSSGSQNQRNEIMSDVWVFATDKTPFKWVKLDIIGSNPSARLYHSACVYSKYNGGSDAMILFGGRGNQNSSLKDLNLLYKEGSEYKWGNMTWNGDVVPIARHQQSSSIFGPFLFVVGGRASNNTQTTFDVFSFVSKKWFRFGTIGLFRHTVWIYFNGNSNNQEKVELYLFIYGGFDSENNSQINSNLYRINIISLFSKNEILKKELADHINTLLSKSNANNKNNHLNGGNKNHFELNNRVVVYNIPEENNLGTLIKEISYSKLTEVDKKIGDKQSDLNSKRQSEYDEDIVREFLQLLPNPDEEYIPYKNKEEIIVMNKEYISKLITDCKNMLMKSPTVITLRSPVKIFGSINGQYNDLMRYFSLFGRPSEFKGDIECMDYLFLGNLVNRGAFSLETFLLLIALKVKYNNNFHILRGSQDDIEISKHYGLAEECKNKLNENISDKNSIFKKICELFEYLPLAAIINNQIICIHSGIGEHVKTINDINNIKKPISIKDNSIVQELLWSTPTGNTYKEEYNVNNFTFNYRKSHFDDKMLNEFLTQNKMKMLIRSHDVCDSGIEKIFNDKVISIFSATNYCGSFNNSGAMLLIKKSYEIQPKILTCEDNYSVWIKDNWSKSEYPPSPKRIYKNK